MNLKYFFIAILFTAAIACNNEASVEDRTNSVTQEDDSSHSTWPKPGEDSIPSPSTHSDSSHLKSN